MPHKFNMPPCNDADMQVHNTFGREQGRRGVQRPSALWAHTRTTQAYAKGCEAYTAYPRPSTGRHAKTTRRSIISHRIDHRTLHKSSCAATVTAPRLASCHPRGTRPPDTPLTKCSCGGNTVATVHSDLHAVGQLAITPPPRRRRIPPPPHTPPPPPPPPPLLPLRTFSRQTRGLPERTTRCHPPSPQR